MNNKDFETNEIRRTTGSRREGYGESEHTNTNRTEATDRVVIAEGTAEELYEKYGEDFESFEDFLQELEQELEHWENPGLPLLPNVPIGFMLKGNRATATRRAYSVDLTEEYYIPIAEYEKTADEAGLTTLFGSQSDIDAVMKRLANNLKALRKFYDDVPISHIAYSTDVTRQYIGQIEKGEKCPSLEMLCKIAEVFHTNPAMLISLDMPNHYMHYADIMFRELSKKDSDKQLEIFINAIEYIKNA